MTMAFCLKFKAELEEKLGRAILVKLFEFINQGVITEGHLKKISYQHNMNVFTTFDSRGKEERIEVTMERMLDRWFEDTVCKLTTFETFQELLRILKESGCSNLVIEETGKLLVRNARLWGTEALRRLREYVESGDITEDQMKSIADNPEVVAVNANIHQNSSETFERILEVWFEEKVFNCQLAEAQRAVVEVLTRARCSNKVLHCFRSRLSGGR